MLVGQSTGIDSQSSQLDRIGWFVGRLVNQDRLADLLVGWSTRLYSQECWSYSQP